MASLVAGTNSGFGITWLVTVVVGEGDYVVTAKDTLCSGSCCMVAMVAEG